jgi:hypothetical protein
MRLSKVSSSSISADALPFPVSDLTGCLSAPQPLSFSSIRDLDYRASRGLASFTVGSRSREMQNPNRREAVTGQHLQRKALYPYTVLEDHTTEPSAGLAIPGRRSKLHSGRRVDRAPEMTSHNARQKRSGTNITKAASRVRRQHTAPAATDALSWISIPHLSV